MSVMKYKKSHGITITMTLHWHSSQVSSLDNCVDDTPTETGLRSRLDTPCKAFEMESLHI